MDALIFVLAMFFCFIAYLAYLFLEYLSKDEERDNEIKRLSDELKEIKKKKSNN